MKPSSSPSENTTPQHTPTDYAAIVEKHAAYTLTPTTRPDDLLRFESLIRNLGDLRWKIILDVGAGQGEFAYELGYRMAQVSWESELGYVVWIDIYPEVVEQAQKRGELMNNYGNVVFKAANPVNAATLYEVLWNSHVDHAYSTYVFEAIPDKQTIQNIFDGVYNQVRDGGSFQFLIGNVEEFYGKQSFCFAFSDKLPRPTQDGDPYITLLGKEGDPLIEVHDFYRSFKTLTEMLEQAGFSDIKIEKKTFTGDEYEGMRDEKDVAATALFSCKKKIPVLENVRESLLDTLRANRRYS